MGCSSVLDALPNLVIFKINNVINIKSHEMLFSLGYSVKFGLKFFNHIVIIKSNGMFFSVRCSYELCFGYDLSLRSYGMLFSMGCSPKMCLAVT